MQQAEKINPAPKANLPEEPTDIPKHFSVSLTLPVNLFAATVMRNSHQKVRNPLNAVLNPNVLDE